VPPYTVENVGFGSAGVPGTIRARASLIKDFRDWDRGDQPFADRRKPTLNYENSANGDKWRLSIYTPMRWSDRSGFVHAEECDSGEWRDWLDAIAPQIIESWRKQKSNKQDFVVEITLRDKAPDSVLKFVPELDEQTESLTKIIEDLSGLSNGEPLANFLPRKATDAEFVFLKLQFQKIKN
jgi:hypothetical protein